MKTSVRKSWGFRAVQGVTLMVMLCAEVPAADEVPTTGMIYNSQETHSITYDCKKVSIDTIDCDLVQTAVRRKKVKEDFEEDLKSALAEFREKGRGMLGRDMCGGTLQMMIDVFDGRRKPPKGDKELLAMPPAQKQDMRQAMKTMLDFCDTPSESNVKKMMEAIFSKDSRTCLVSSHRFGQRFVRVTDYSDQKARWVVQSSPEGPCGVVNLSRFEPAESGVSGLMFWNYLAKKSVTNPRGKTLLGLSCAQLDEREYLYEWRQNEKYVECDYIEFSPL